ncbi:hypothetical protein BU26DRAFT_512346 [Trematosphaeria pertusa]|uniref:Uncharacterized protein n=1 Tax=Trematosphaeria pertusa TaxID=390896 RepID=A0A6A6HRZ7_9PLEO|nr:uncharacterized protein BU26DRAFT_512346 [Trematosphaeria pertusa]KAF2240313.1 hypothetical protein BU26DRAFT_512346 [Trematosphaeria pertusa]
MHTTPSPSLKQGRGSMLASRWLCDHHRTVVYQIWFQAVGVVLMHDGLEVQSASWSVGLRRRRCRVPQSNPSFTSSTFGSHERMHTARRREVSVCFFGAAACAEACPHGGASLDQEHGRTCSAHARSSPWPSTKLRPFAESSWHRPVRNLAPCVPVCCTAAEERRRSRPTASHNTTGTACSSADSNCNGSALVPMAWTNDNCARPAAVSGPWGWCLILETCRRCLRRVGYPCLVPTSRPLLRPSNSCSRRHQATDAPLASRLSPLASLPPGKMGGGWQCV